MSHAHTNTLIAERKAHLANVAMLKARAPRLESDAAARAAQTIANLKQQISAIEAQLGRYAGRAAA
ncbi:hypothetical protein [Pseudomonas sp. MYb185]|uniref:hypothetical protein n=1 Tax=Pseudomonas sp. MYb185 TaxID=1848729 RepID=UPI000CFDC227|nr:hypothetical protein [Pseudomonas sp. MYb185]PRB80501.1 hypothetical protein CQ007_12315 [Pseudomonas sp. MYb185]